MPSLESSCFSESKARFSLTDVFLEHRSMSELAAVSHIYENIMLHFLWWGPQGFPYCICEGREATGSNLTPTLTLPCLSLCSRILQIKPELLREHAFVSTKEASGICFSTTLTSWCLSPQLPGWILEGFFYLNKQTALNEDYQDYYYHDHVVVIALTLQRKHTRWTRRRWVCHPLTSVTICRYRKYLIFLVKKSPFSAKAVVVYTGYFLCADSYWS